MGKKKLKRYQLKDIKRKLEQNEFPFSGITELGSAEFHFLKPAFYAGIVLHANSRIRAELIEKTALTKEQRHRDEDPFTELFIKKFPVQIIARDSRFEYDLNRDRESCIYKKYKKKWDLLIWKQEPNAKEREVSCEKFDEFFNLMEITCDFLLKQNRYAFIFDMHSFCYRRFEDQKWFIDAKPEINIGTKASNKELFDPLINYFQKSLSKTIIDGHKIRVAENDIFKGGYLSRRVGKKYYNQILTYALEYKKIFMDEITGELYPEVFEKLVADFEQSVEQLLNSKKFLKNYISKPTG